MNLRHWLCSSRQLLRESWPAWTHAPSQPLMRSPLSQFQTSADISQRRRFFRVWQFGESPRLPITRSNSSGQPIIEALSFRPSTVNLRHWLCSSRQLLRESWPAWTHVPSQLLMRSPLSQFQTSADISQRRRFFRVWRFRESPRSPTVQSTSGGQRIIEAHTFGPSTVDLPHWLCSSRQLLRESCRRGRMDRRSS